MELIQVLEILLTFSLQKLVTHFADEIGFVDRYFMYMSLLWGFPLKFWFEETFSFLVESFVKDPMARSEIYGYTNTLAWQLAIALWAKIPFFIGMVRLCVWCWYNTVII